MDAGAIVGHYRIIRTLGKGGMGEVFLANDLELKRQVALKILPEAVRRDAMRLARFRTEAEAAAKLNHPNIAQIYSIEDTDGHLFITMEYIEGKSLLEHIAPEGLAVEPFLTWFVPLSDALGHAHDQGVIHRDLKPGNIMIRNDGVPKILDFGLARIVPLGPELQESDSEAVTKTMQTDDPDDVPTLIIPTDQPPSEHPLTKYGQVMGTTYYMSPEQAQGLKVDIRSDIFSFGVVIYETLTGQKPFVGKTLTETISKILQTDPKPMRDLNATLPEGVADIVDRCLVKAPDNRCQSMQDVSTALLAVRTNPPPSAIR